MIGPPLSVGAPLAPPAPLADRVAATLRALRVHYQRDEYGLQKLLADALAAASLPFTREVVLAPRNRIDFIVGDATAGAPASGWRALWPSEDMPAIGIEVKKGKPNARALADQARRYAEAAPWLTALFLVVERSVSRLPSAWCVRAGARDIPVTVISLNKQWGVAA